MTLFSDGMGHCEEEQVPGHAKGLPSRLPIFDSILHRNIKRIVEHGAGFLKGYAVLAPVGEVLRLVPLEAYAFHTVMIIIKL
jgi:hypothetical protein